MSAGKQFVLTSPELAAWFAVRFAAGNAGQAAVGLLCSVGMAQNESEPGAAFVTYRPDGRFVFLMTRGCASLDDALGVLQQCAVHDAEMAKPEDAA